MPDYLSAGKEYVAYTDDNLEALLHHYLEHEQERRTIADAARARVRGYSFEQLWDRQLALIEAHYAELLERAQERARRPQPPSLRGRLWQVLSCADGGDPTLAADLAGALVRHPGSADLHNALGLVTALTARNAGAGTSEVARQVSGYFERAAGCDPTHVLAALNAAESLAASGYYPAATGYAERALAVLDSTPDLSPGVLDSAHFPVGFDLFRVEWERAAWDYAGDPAAETLAKRALLRWRLHSLLADLTGSSSHAYEAALARPDLPSTRAALGLALVRAGSPAAAVPHLWTAVEANPFDLEAARALFQALGDSGNGIGQRRLADERRLLARAAPRVVPVEEWMERVPPAGDELVSIIVLCCNEVAYTRQCLESVLRNTRPPYELVLVDNGSTDATPAYLAELSTCPGPVRVVVLANAENRGFAAGCNQGIAAARGRYLVFLNNDTVVPPGWLEGLVAWSLHEWPHTGLVCPVSNYAPPPQYVPAGYADVKGLESFAAQRRQQYAGKALQADRLTGFCLLVRSEVLRVVGAFDEGYGVGFFEDDDLCVRARQAGFGLLVAQDVFVHHFGSRTFAGLGIDTHAQLHKNFAQFKARWGEEHAAGYHLPEGPSLPSPFTPLPSPLPPAERQRVTLCMIVKNEETNLPACLESAADLVDEIIVADTGSTDGTKEVAARYGARVVDFSWVDSFAAARNAALDHATGSWIFWLDADDRIDDANRARLRALFAGLRDDNAAYAMKCLCLADPVSKCETVVDHVRLYRNRPDIRWEHRVHEQILPAVRRTGGEVRWSDVTILHAGYQDPALRGKKLQRDLHLLQLEHQEQPDHPFTLFNLASVYLELGRALEALPLLKRSLVLSHPSDSIVRKLYALIAQCHRHFSELEEALEVCAAGRAHYPEDPELLFQEGLTRRERGDTVGSEACFLRLLEARDADYFASLDAGIRGYKARHNLAVLYQESGRSAEAEAQWQACLAEQPTFGPAWLGLAELELARGRWPQLAQLLDHLTNVLRMPAEAGVLRARAHLARREFGPARRLLEQTIAQEPEVLWPRVVLSQVLLQEGRDTEAAERTLREILARDPEHAQSRQNLNVLLRQQARAQEKAAG